MPACLLCPDRDAGPGRYGCWDCVNTLLRVLRELENYTLMLAVSTTPARRRTERRAPGFGSRSPARDHVLAALDPRSLPGDVDADGRPLPHRPEDTAAWPRSITASIAGIAEWLRDEQDHPHPGGRSLFSRDLGYLRTALDWCSRQPWIDELADDLRELHAQARAHTGDAPPPPLGTCLNVGCEGLVYPATIGHHDEHGEDGPRDGARCRDCRRVYDGLDLIRLHVAQDAA